jgi:very-short-patch-repair endonuclease
MPNESIITRQTVSTQKNNLAHDLRREMTPAERKLWSRLRAGRLEGFHFRRQQIVEPYIVDFYCHQAALVVEVDGGVHLEQQEYDRQREQDLRDAGLRVIRFWNTDVNQNLDGVLEEILRACKARGNLSLTLPTARCFDASNGGV